MLSSYMCKQFSKRTFSTFYTKNHEWIKFEDKRGVIGITDYAQEQLGDIVYTEFDDNITIDKGEILGNLESIKATSDVFAPVDCSVIEVNNEIINNPGIINQDAEINGWIIKVEILNDNRDELLNKDEYTEFIGNI